MFKKLALLALVVVVGLIILKKTELGSLVRVWWHDGKAHLEASIDPETRIKQLRQELTQVEGRLKKAALEQTRLEVAFGQKQDEVEEMKKKQTQRAGDMTAMLRALEAETKLVTFDGKPIESSELQKRLEQTTRAFTATRDELKVREEILVERKQVVEANDARIQQMIQRQQELTLFVEKLEAKLALLRLKQTENRSILSGNEMAEAERLLNQLQTRLLEEEKLEEVNTRYGLTPARTEPTRPSLEETKKAARKALEE